MGEMLSLFYSSFNKSLRIESWPERLTGESGAIVLREIMERIRFIEWMVDCLHYPRGGDRRQITRTNSRPWSGSTRLLTSGLRSVLKWNYLP